MTTNLSSIDPHTYHQVGQPVPVHVKFEIMVSFRQKRLHVTQSVCFDKPGTVTFDSFGQTEIRMFEGFRSVPFQMGELDPILGAPVTFDVPESLWVDISFVTSATAKGLQWLTPTQAGGAHPLVYSQFESINGRSAFILPDSPRIRFSYMMRVVAPSALRSLTTNGHALEEHVRGNDRYTTFTTPHSVPLYLVALNVGDFHYHAFDERTGVWAQPHMLEQSKAALAKTPELLATLEQLFGPYRWGTYSTVVLPPLGYPFGGMEHPCLTSMNGMLMTDPEEAARVTLHEMLHSWFGNLITNASWEDFWLNEGVTSFAEWLATGKVFGDSVFQLQAAQAIEELRLAISAFESKGEYGFTRLKQNLTGKDPEDAFSRVPYYKGALFMWALMEKVGESRMIKLLRTYIDRFAFAAIDTETFLRFLADELGEEVLERAESYQWVFESGFPSKMPYICVAEADAVRRYAQAGLPPERPVALGWGHKHWMYYFSSLQVNPGHGTKSYKGACLFTQLDHWYGFSASPNAVLRFEFLRAAAQYKWSLTKYVTEIEAFLLSYGRTVYIKPLYEALCEWRMVSTAGRIFTAAKNGYHPIGVEQVRRLLSRYGI